MRNILYFALFVLFAGCVTQKRCNYRFPPSVDSIRIETIKDSIVLKDTVIYIPIPGERVIDSVEIPCPEVLGYIPKRVYAETSLAKASAWWQFPNIILELLQKDTTIIQRLDNALRDAYHWKTLYEKITVTPQPVKYIPKIYKQSMVICIFIFIFAFLFMGWKAYKFFKK